MCVAAVVTSDVGVAVPWLFPNRQLHCKQCRDSPPGTAKRRVDFSLRKLVEPSDVSIMEAFSGLSQLVNPLHGLGRLPAPQHALPRRRLAGTVQMYRSLNCCTIVCPSCLAQLTASLIEVLLLVFVVAVAPAAAPTNATHANISEYLEVLTHCRPVEF